MAVDVDTVLTEMQLVGTTKATDVLTALTAPPVLTRTMDGASTVEMTVQDWDRTLLRAGVFSSRVWTVVDDVVFELVKVTKTGDRLTLTYEDAIVAALRRRKDPLSIPAGSTTRAEVVARLASEAGVTYDVDTARRSVINTAVERSVTDESDSWTVLGELADTIGWRRFSDGRRLVVGGDEWLTGRGPAWPAAELSGPVYHVDFDLDVGKPAAEATLEVDARRWAIWPGRAVTLTGLGPADGAWLVKEVTRPLTRQRATVTLTRSRLTLPEPPPAADAVPGSEAGELDFLPGDQALTGDEETLALASSAAGPSRPTGSPVDRMIDYAVAQKGKPYVWGGSGPRGFDCSGLVQEATRAAGRVLPKPSKAQWDRGRRDGYVITVDEALRTRGALLVRMNTNPTHIAISLGNGSTVEARGRASGVGVFGGAAWRKWTGAFIWIGAAQRRQRLLTPQ